MKKSRVLLKILKTTHTDQIALSFIIFTFMAALGILVVEPAITNYGDALWFSFTAFTTIGFGDIVVTTLLGRVITIILSLYGIIVVALIPGVVVSYFTERLRMQSNESLLTFLDKLEHLPELTKEELCEMAEKAKEQRKKQHL